MKHGALTWMFAALGLLLAVPAHAADTVYYYSSDTIHSEVVVTDQNRNVVERTHYAPYGQVLDRDLRDGPGYTGHEEDPETSLVYMQQRYYDPEAGRFLSVDPVGVDPTSGGNFNRYEYANDNPYRFIDPDGRDCKTVNKVVTCTEMVTGSHIPQKFSFPAPTGWPTTINASQTNYHSYDKMVSAGSGSAGQAGAIRQALVNDPTPGNDKPATPLGTANNATPQHGLLGVAAELIGAKSPVMSYTRTDANGNTMVVNVTLPGHPLFPGYAARLVETSGGVSTVHNFGEGTARLQSYGVLSDKLINNVWINQSQQDINQATGH